jgi:pimeloyl-ACP methyl ester carboxylesterase
MSKLKAAQTEILEIAYFDHGPPTGWPVVLVHGFPYDVHAFDGVVPRLTQAGARVIVPYVRGYGPTRFLFKEQYVTTFRATEAGFLLCCHAWNAREGFRSNRPEAGRPLRAGSPE